MASRPAELAADAPNQNSKPGSLKIRMLAQSKLVVVYVVFLLSLSLLLWLGGWQWQRGVEKAALETWLQSASPQQYTTLDRAPQNWSELAYQKVRLRGKWLKQPLLLMANRTHRGRAGYEVFSPFQLQQDRATLLINRGWVETAAVADATALIAGLLAEAAVGGQLYLPEKGFTLGAAYVAPTRRQTDAPPSWVKTIQYFDAPALSALFGVALQPAVVVLDAHHPGAFTKIWRAHAMRSTQHFGYAVQWWGLALTLIVFGVIWRRSATATATATRRQR